MIRKIIHIDEDKCNGCGLCVTACHEGAIEMVGGKARLTREDYCDGLGDCLPACPTEAITFEEREAPAYDHAAVVANQAAKAAQAEAPEPCGCPGTRARQLDRRPAAPAPEQSGEIESRLRQWPVQIKLVSVNAPYFDNANLLVAADCTAFAHGDFHRKLMQNRVTIIGCPKLDAGDYSEKLTEIIRRNNIKSVTVARMEVPCCGGLEHAVRQALQNSGKHIPWRIVVIGTDGTILED